MIIGTQSMLDRIRNILILRSLVVSFLVCKPKQCQKSGSVCKKPKNKIYPPCPERVPDSATRPSAICSRCGRVITDFLPYPKYRKNLMS